MYLYWCYYLNRWDAILGGLDADSTFEQGENWLLNTHIIAPIAITQIAKDRSGYVLVYYRDASPDLLHKLMQRGWMERQTHE